LLLLLKGAFPLARAAALDGLAPERVHQRHTGAVSMGKPAGQIN
jgi:hypothetical protein